MKHLIFNLFKKFITKKKQKMKIFTINSGVVVLGATVETFQLKNSEVKIPAILIGESGRGRQLGVLPVSLTEKSMNEWKEKGRVKIIEVCKTTTKTGNPKLIEIENSENDSSFIGVFNTKIGFRGGNEHTGDYKEGGGYYLFPAPLSIIVGMIAQGIAGNMGNGMQLVAELPANVVFRTAYTGRLYGAASEHFYCFRDGFLLVASAVEREVSEIF